MTWRRLAPWAVPLVLASLGLLAEGERVLCIGLALAVALLQPLVLRPTFGVVLPSIAATVSCAALSAAVAVRYPHLMPPALSAEHPISVDPPGPHTLSLRSLPEVPGARVVLLDARGQPSEEALRAGDFHALFQGQPVDRTCWHVFVEGCLFDALLSRDDHPADGEPIEVDYVVNAESRPLLAGAKLSVTVPFPLGGDYAGAAAFWSFVTLALGAATVVGAFGLFVAWARWRVTPPPPPRDLTPP